MLVRPLKKTIRDPKTMAILSHDEPTEVPDNSYWNRRIRDGDVEEVEPKATKKQTRKPAAERADKE